MKNHTSCGIKICNKLYEPSLIAAMKLPLRRTLVLFVRYATMNKHIFRQTIPLNPSYSCIMVLYSCKS